MKADTRIIPATKETRNLKLLVSLCAVFLLLSVYYHLEHQVEIRAVLTQNTYVQKAEFRVIKPIKGIYTFSNVCIESLATPKVDTRLGPRGIFNETKKIVVYGNNSLANGTRMILKVAGSFHSSWNHWEIHFRQQVLPSQHTRYLRNSAFFVQPTCPANFHHFIIDEFIPLYSIVVLSNRLHEGARNQILYRTPRIGTDEDRCTSRRTYEEFLKTLYIDDFHDVFYNLPNNTCFRHAVFGSRNLQLRQRDVVDHVLRHYNLTLHSNRNASDLYFTLLVRKYRRIINADEVLSFAKQVGFKKARIVEFANKSIHYQLAIMSTSNVFVGIQGAGLQWSMFMPSRSYLIEFAWPQKHWPFNFNHYVSPFGVTWKGVGVRDVRLNWNSYVKNVGPRRGVPVTEAEKPTLIRRHPITEVDNIWKWCDIVVQRNETLRTFQAVFDALKAFQKSNL